MKNGVDEIIKLTKSLIRFKTFSKDYKQLDECARFIEIYLGNAGIEYIRKDIDKVPNILVLPGGKKIPVLLMSHIDVVDGPARLFEPEVRDGRLYGRGSIDDKYAVALSLVLIKKQLDRQRIEGKDQKDLNFGILINGDEETGGMNGAAKLLEQIQPEFSIALDGGHTDEIIIKEKGILRLKLESHGKTCHGSRPWQGENAIENLIQDLSIIRGYFQDTAPDNWNRTISPTIVKGGQVVNQVPDYCSMLFDVRFTETDDMITLIEKLKKDIQGKLIVESMEPVFKTEPSPFLDELLALDTRIKTGFEHGASDARHLMKFGLNGVVWGAQGNLSCHALDEHVEIESIQILYDRLDRFLTHM